MKNKTNYIGQAPISQVRLMNAHPTGAMNKGERLTLLIGPGGIQECNMAQNGVETCPKGIPLTTSIASINRETTVKMFRNFLGSDHVVN